MTPFVNRVNHCIISEDFKQFFMDCQLDCASTLSWMWVIETLAYSDQVDLSLLMDLIRKTPKKSDTISRKAIERVSLRVLESISVLGACENSVSSDSSSKIRFDPSASCEDALRQIVTETSTSTPKTDQLGTSKWDYEPFIASKRSSQAKCALQQLKDAILTEGHPLASLKDQSGLLIGNQSEHRVPVDENNWDTEGPNDKSDVKLRQDQDMEEAKVDEEGFCETKTYEDVNEPNNKKDAPYIGEGEEYVNNFPNTDAYHHDRTDIASNINASLSPQFTDSPDYSATTNFRGLNILAHGCDLSNEVRVGGMVDKGHYEDGNNKHNSSKRLAGPDEFFPCEEQAPHFDKDDSPDSSAATSFRRFNILVDVCNRIQEFYSSSNEVHVGGMVDKGHSEDGNNKHNSSKRLAGPDEFFPCEEQAPHCDKDVPNEIFDEEQEQDHDIGELKTNNEGMEPEKNIPENVPNVGETGNANIACDNDRYHNEKTDNPGQNNAFLSSQFVYNQDFWAKADWRELNHCIKCNKGEKLLVCSSNSSMLVIHERCLGPGASFDTRSRKYSQEKSCSSYGLIKNHFQRDDHFHTCNEQIRKFVGKGKKCWSRKKMENELSGSVLSTFDNPPEKSVDSMNGMVKNLNEDKPKENLIAQNSQSLRVHGRHQMTALASCKFHGENTEIRCKKRVLCQSETDLLSENTFSPSTESTNAEEMSVEGNENSIASKKVRFQKLQRQSSSPANSQSRRKRLMWTAAEELKLEDGIEIFCGPEDRAIPWKKILEFGADVFHESRSTIDLKDKYRNICKAKKKA